MTPEQIIRRVAEQSFLLCFEPDEKDEGGRVVKNGKRITNKDVGKALNALLKEDSDTR